MTTPENLGPAEHIINTLLSYADHAVHNRPGVVTEDARSNVGVKWEPVTHRVESGLKVVYKLTKNAGKSGKIRLGVLQANNQIVESGRVVGRYQPSGVFQEVATWMYKQVAAVWQLNNEFAARWASHAFQQEHRDLKVILAAFMLVQSRKGDPVRDGGKVAFFDDDFRDVGEAMFLITRKDNRDLSAKLLLRVYDVLSLPGVAEANRAMGFGKSARETFYGRWEKAVTRWLRYREENVKMLEGLMKVGFKSTIKKLAQLAGYKPTTTRFFQILRWKQKQSADGHRSMAIGQEISLAETWQGLTEREICVRIMKDRPGFKRICGLLPNGMGLTRAIMTAAIEAGALGDKDMIIYAPTLEELGLLGVQEVKERLDRAVRAAEDSRAANIATRVKSKELKDKLQEASDNAMKKAVEVAMRNMRVYLMVDISASQKVAIDASKKLLAKFVQAFPLDKLHVATFNTYGEEILIRHASAAGVEQAFRGKNAGGGTAYGAGVRALQHRQPLPDEDVIFIFVGDEEQGTTFEGVVQQSGLRPTAFGLIRTPGEHNTGATVRATATRLNVPCFLIDEKTFEDPYAIPRTINALISSTPVGNMLHNFRTDAAKYHRETLVETILKTQLLQKPVWAMPVRNTASA